MNAPLDQVLAAYRTRLEAIYGDRLINLVLFGSRARGDAEEDSDIDLMIVLSGPIDRWAEIQRTSNSTSDVAIAFDVDIYRTFATPEKLADSDFSFFKNVRSEGVPV